jgi:hypothetical protein
MVLILATPTLNNTRDLHKVKPGTVKASAIILPPAEKPQIAAVPAASAPASPPVVQQPAPVDLSDHAQLMSLAGISQSDWPAVDYIVTHESSWNTDATEPNSGAHGLVQALPYSKTGCGWDDAVCQLSWGQAYAISRYGGWWAAMGYWEVHHNW